MSSEAVAGSRPSQSGAPTFRAQVDTRRTNAYPRFDSTTTNSDASRGKDLPYGLQIPDRGDIAVSPLQPCSHNKNRNQSDGGGSNSHKKAHCECSHSQEN